jgi:hypothetical protein
VGLISLVSPAPYRESPVARLPIVWGGHLSTGKQYPSLLYGAYTRNLMKVAYYRRLLTDQRIRGALNQLYGDLSQHWTSIQQLHSLRQGLRDDFAALTMLRGPVTEIVSLATRWESETSYPEGSILHDYARAEGNYYRTLEKMQLLVLAFDRESILPPDAFDDLLESWSLGLFDQEPVLTVASVTGSFPVIVPIQPPTLGSILYNPGLDGRPFLRDQIKNWVKQLTESAYEQANDVEERFRRAGWLALPAKFYDRRNLTKGAERLYLRVVQRMTYGEIAVATKGGRSTVQGQIQKWGSDLDIPLP